MMFLTQVHLSCVLMTYLLAFAGELHQLMRRRSAVLHYLMILVAAAGVVAHSLYLYKRSLLAGLPPLLSSSHDWLMVLAWMGAVVYFVILTGHRRATLGLLLLPVVLVMIVIAGSLSDLPTDAGRQLSVRRWGMLHAGSLVIGIAAVGGAVVAATAYLIQFRRLRGGVRRLKFVSLPSLERLTLINRWMVVVSVPLLTIGLLTGWILSIIGTGPEKPTDFSWTEPLVVGFVVVWIAMLGTLIRLLTRRAGSGRQVAQMTFVAGGFLLVTMLGLMAVTGGIHPESDPGASAGNGRPEESLQTTEEEPLS